MDIFTEIRPLYLLGGIVLWNLGFLVAVWLNGRWGELKAASASAVAAVTSVCAALALTTLAVSTTAQRHVLRPGASIDEILASILLLASVLGAARDHRNDNCHSPSNY